MPYPITSVLLSIRGGIAAAAAPVSSLLTSLAAFWNLADTSDSSGNGNTLTNNGSVSFANDGQIGKCATFTGANYLSIADNDSLSHNGSLTIAGWFYLANITTGTERLVSKWDVTTEYRVYKEATNLKGNINTSNDAIAAMDTLTINTWHSFIFVFDSVGQTLQMWIDNSITAGAIAYVDGLSAGTSPFALGANDEGISGFMTGRLNLVGVWKKVFTAGERACFHNGGAGTIYPFTGLCT